MYIKSYKELKVWQKSIDLVEEVYVLTSKMPKEETYSLIIQERRAAISVPSNISEGYRRKDLSEFLQFLRIADASSAELETQIIVSKRLYPNLDYSKADALLEEIQKMLNAMVRILDDKLKAQSSKLKAFTIVEFLVAMGLFVVLIGIATGSFIKALQTQKAVVGLMEANDNASLALEQMAREIRTGYNFSRISDTELRFVNQFNQVIWYRLNEKAIERGTEKEGVVSRRIYKKITADNVKIMNFKVALFGANIGDGFPPRITISLSVGSTGRHLENILTNIQTTISARTLDS